MAEKIRPLVTSPTHRGKRAGKGFSLGELQAVGLNPSLAKRMGLPFDKRRRSVHQENVELLKSYLESVKNK